MDIDVVGFVIVMLNGMGVIFLIELYFMYGEVVVILEKVGV